jgi:hypothetical protein
MSWILIVFDCIKWIGISLGIIFIGYAIAENTPSFGDMMQENNETYGLFTLNTAEAKCFNFCDGDYYFSNGGLFSNDHCQCGKQIMGENK